MFCICLVSCLLATTPAPVGNPCNPSPCGPNSQCRVVGTQPACSCLPNYVGRAPNCRPECTLDAECPSNLACQNEHCRNPCSGACGSLAQCTAVNHHAVCTCPQGYTGDPSSACILAPPPCKDVFWVKHNSYCQVCEVTAPCIRWKNKLPLVHFIFSQLLLLRLVIT